MRVPGVARLELEVEPTDHGARLCRRRRSANTRFASGLYWYAVAPFHDWVFRELGAHLIAEARAGRLRATLDRSARRRAAPRALVPERARSAPRRASRAPSARKLWGSDPRSRGFGVRPQLRRRTKTRGRRAAGRRLREPDVLRPADVAGTIEGLQPEHPVAAEAPTGISNRPSAPTAETPLKGSPCGVDLLAVIRDDRLLRPAVEHASNELRRRRSAHGRAGS